MDILTLYKNKEQIIRSILDADEDTITEISEILVRHEKRPAQMTVEELKKEVRKATESLENGEGIKHEDFIKLVDTWI